MKRQPKLSRVVIRGFTLIIVSIVILGVWGYWADQEVVDENEALLHLHTTVKQLTDLERLLYNADAGSRNYVVTGKEEFYEPFTLAKSELNDKLAQINSLFAEHEEQAKRLAELDDLAHKTIDYKEQVIAKEKEGKHAEAVALIAAGTGIHLVDESKKKSARSLRQKWMHSTHNNKPRLAPSSTPR